MLKSVLTRLKKLENLTPNNDNIINITGLLIDIDDNGNNINKYYVKYTGSDAKHYITEQEYDKYIKFNNKESIKVEIIDD